MPVTHLIQDLRFALRQIFKRPGSAVVALSVLALGIGSSTAVFSVLYQAVLKSLPYPDSEQLLFIHNFLPKSQVSTTGVSAFDYSEIKRRQETFAKAGAFYWNDLTLTGIGSAQHIDVVNASASLFEALGVKPQIGRVFSEAEDRRGADGKTLLSDSLWRGAFGSDPHVLGRVIHLNGAPFTVVGVMPASFQFPSRETQLWIPLALPPESFTIEGGRMEKWLHMIVRLAPGVTPQRAGAALEAISAALGSRFQPFYPTKDGWHFTARPLADEQTMAIRRWLYLAFGAVFSVLLIACINVSGLLLIRATARQGEIALRMAIGATKRRIVGQMLTETALLAFTGSILGALFAWWAVHLINLYGPLSTPTTVNAWTLLFALALAIVSTILVGLLPALFAVDLSFEQTLRSDANGTSTRSGGWRNFIAAAQIALALALVFTAAQMSRSLVNLTRVPPGFNPLHVWSGAIDLPSKNYAAPRSWDTRFFQPLLAELATVPGVQSVSGSNAIPFNPSGIWTERLQLPEQPAHNPPAEAQIGLTFPGYFEAMGIPILRGRTFTSRDNADSPNVAVIDQELARRYFPGDDPVGKLIASGGARVPAHIIGVVGSVHNSDLGALHEPQVYYQEFQEPTEAMYLVLRMKDDIDPTAAVRQVIAKLDPGAALFDVQFMNARVSRSLKLRRFVAFLLSGLALTGLGLALIGLYGSLAHLVELRQREIGIRLALGATPPQVLRMILTRGILVVASGFLGGAVTATVAGRAVSSQLFGVRLSDPAIWIGVLAVLAISAAASAFLPALRASRVEPAIALRHE